MIHQKSTTKTLTYSFSIAILFAITCFAPGYLCAQTSAESKMATRYHAKDSYLTEYSYNAKAATPIVLEVSAQAAVEKTKEGACLSSTFTGNVNNAWELSSNWTCGIPTSAVDAFIQAGAVCVINSAAVAKTLTVNPNSSVTVKSGFSLRIYN